MKFFVGDKVEIVNSATKRLIGEIGDVIAVDSSKGRSYVRFENPELHQYHDLFSAVQNSRLFPNERLKPFDDADLNVSEADLMELIGVTV